MFTLVIHRKTLIAMIFIGLTLLGYVSYRQLPVELLPNAELPLLVVFVMSYQDADPDYLENRAIIPIEGAIGTLPDIERIESVARQRSGSVWIYYNQNTGMKYAYLKLQAKINEIRADLPDGLVVEVVRFDTEERGNEYMTLQVRGGGGLDRVRSIVDRTILGRLESIDGVAKVEIFGGREKAVEVILDEEACRAHGITPAEVPALIMRNGQSNTFVGHVAGGDRRYFVSVLTEYADIRELENIVVRDPGSVLLGDVADIYFGVKQENSISRINGKEALTIRLSRESQVNLIDLSNATRAVIDDLNAVLETQDVEVVVQHDSAGYIRENIDTIVRLALIGGLLAVAILWMFLGNIRLVLVIALAIPISVFTAFNFFYAFGISINTLTLIGIALAIGMLLDNSIVVLENIYRHAAAGAGRDEAVVYGTREVWRSIVAATLTTITVFLPFVFSSVATLRLIGRHIGVSIISTLLLSLVVALLLVPMIAHSILKGGARGTTRFQVLTRRSRALQVYNLLLKTGLRFPVRTIIGSIVLFFASIFICLAVSITVPRQVETNEIVVYVNMPRGATLELTDEAVTELEKRLEGVAEKQDIFSEIGEESATIRVTLKDGYSGIDNRTYADIKADIKGRVGDFAAGEVSLDAPLSGGGFERGGGGMGGGEGAGFMRMLGIGQTEEKVVVRGSDFPTMVSVAENVRFYLQSVSSISESEINISENSPEIHLMYDEQLISHYGVTMRQIAEELRAFEGEFTSDRLKYKQGVDEYDIVIRRLGGADEARAKTIDDLRRLPIAGEGGATHELQNLSRILYAYGKTNVRRVNQERLVEVRYGFASEINESKSLLETARLDVEAVVASLKVPPGIALEVIHDETDYGQYLFLVAVAFILIYMILASVFESLTAPVVIMFTIPLAAAGSFWALIFTKTSLFTAYTITGFLILLGIVVNNGIILIDYTRILRERGNRRARALMTAGQARLRPILITAITTIVGMIPLAMGKVGESMISGAPFAVTVIGGLSLSTLFTLVLIPVVYSGLESALRWIRELRMPVKIVQLAVFVLGCWYIYDGIDRLIWKLAALVSLVFLVPSATYVLMASLRRARVELIAPGDSIRIVIKNLTKVYDRDARFVREWKKGKKISGRAFRGGAGAQGPRSETVPDDGAGARGGRFDAFVWQIPLLGFAIYFVYVYLHSLFWAFVLSHVVYALLLFVWRPLGDLLSERSASRGAAANRPARLVTGAIIWGVPLFNVAFFYWEWRNTAVAIFIGCIWYSVLVVYGAAERLHRYSGEIERITGRFARITKPLYRAILLIPVIGRRKSPLRALDRVSMEITHGMFGLLGPNGAGKTTLMRVICGVLEQSFGRVWINGIDTREKREELQGLIGYLPQEFGTYENLTAYEFLNYQAMLKNLLDEKERERMIDYALSAVHIEEHRNRKIGTFSGGMKQRVGIAQTLLHLPRILVVDEPTAGLDPRERIRFRNLLVELSRERVVIFSTHIIEDISSSCNQVAVLNEGRLCHLGPPAGMTEIARGHVWQLHVPAHEFESVRERFLVVHHMRDGDRVRVRCLAGKKPAAEALSVNPTLEDAYLWLLRSGAAGGCGEETEDRP